MAILLEKLTRSSSFMNSKESLIDDQYRWESTKNFMYLAFTYSSTNLNFDIFSKISDPATVFDYVIMSLIVGMTYMVMDFFVKQYTGKIDFNQLLNPLLKGITCGLLMQSGLWILLHSGDLADSVRYFFISLGSTPAWATCDDKQYDASCQSITEMVIKCTQHNQKTSLNDTSVYQYYIQHSATNARSAVTTRFFLLVLVWIVVFFLATVSSNSLLKFFKVTSYFRFISTVLIATILIFTLQDKLSPAFATLMTLNLPNSRMHALQHVTYIYGIGLIGIYDFGSMSPYTVIDNAVVIFTFLQTVLAVLRSLIVRILYLLMLDCIKELPREMYVDAHFRMFVYMPLGTELLHAQKIFLFYLYLNMILTLSTHLAVVTAMMSRLIHSEFRTIKTMYTIGVICFFGCWLSLVVTIFLHEYDRAFKHALYVCMLYLGAGKTAIIMWVYGVQRFATDIQFWLGFKPTRFWTLSWVLIPIVLTYFIVDIFVNIDYAVIWKDVLVTLSWIGFTFLLVLIFNIKTITWYMVHSNLVAAFRCSAKYGPPDAEERKRRRKYNVTLNFRQCEHNCNLLDDRFDCMHVPVTYRKASDADEDEEVEEMESLTHLFQEQNRKSRTSSLIDVQQLHYD